MTIDTSFDLLQETLQRLLPVTQNPPKLIIFDFDGTLVEFKTDVILPGVCEFFQALAEVDGKPFVAIASNQGGVGMRYWMQEGGFGGDSYLKYPTLDEAEARFKQFTNTLPPNVDMPIFVCYAYKSSKGNWATPPSFVDEMDKQWWASHRKPESGMLRDAMTLYGVSPLETLMVGDMAEDQIAANAAGCHFIHADTFFGRPSPDVQP